MTEALALNTVLSAPPPSVPSLSQKFKAVAKNMALTGAFRAAAVGATTAVLAPTALGSSAVVGLAAGVGGLTVTGYEIYKDYNAFRATQEDKPKGFLNTLKSLFGFVNTQENKKKYAKKLAFNTGFAVVGAEVAEHWDTIKHYVTPKNILASTAALALTARTLHQDYSASTQNQPPRTLFQKTLGLASFAGQHKGTYAKTLAKNAAIAFSAAEIGEHLVSPALAEDDFKELTTNGILQYNLETLGPLPEIPAEAPTPEGATGAEPPPATPPEPFSLETLDTTGWDQKALHDLTLAKEGHAWAIQNLAHYEANGLHGMEKNLAHAHTLAEKAQSLGNKLSARFLADLDKISGADHPLSHPPVHDTLSASEDVTTIRPNPVVLKNLENAGLITIDPEQVTAPHTEIPYDTIEQTTTGSPESGVERITTVIADADTTYDMHGWDDWAKAKGALAQKGDIEARHLLKGYAQYTFHGVTEHSLQAAKDSRICHVFPAPTLTDAKAYTLSCNNTNTIVHDGEAIFVALPGVGDWLPNIENNTGHDITVGELAQAAAPHLDPF